jgi:hypothetical protein
MIEEIKIKVNNDGMKQVLSSGLDKMLQSFKYEIEDIRTSGYPADTFNITLKGLIDEPLPENETDT